MLALNVVFASEGRSRRTSEVSSDAARRPFKRHSPEIIVKNLELSCRMAKISGRFCKIAIRCVRRVASDTRNTVTHAARWLKRETRCARDARRDAHETRRARDARRDAQSMSHEKKCTPRSAHSAQSRGVQQPKARPTQKNARWREGSPACAVIVAERSRRRGKGVKASAFGIWRC